MECDNFKDADENSRRKRILVAEDTPSNYKLVEVLLRREYDLEHAWDGAEAVEKFTAHTPDLVLLDIGMPVMDGYEVLRHIRGMGSSVPVVALTAFAFEADRLRMLEAGFDECISKPLNPSELRSKIASYFVVNPN